MTIVQFSDIHLGPHFSLSQLDQLASTLNSLNPDIVVFTGDLFDARRKSNFTNYDPTPALSRIQAPLGKYAIYGNHDFGHTRMNRCTGTFLQKAGFAVLLNESKRIMLPSGEYITVAGLDDFNCGSPDMASAFAKLSDDGFNLLLAHEPDIADRLPRYPIDLQLSGHSHGGQVSLPIVGALIKSSLGRKYIGGLYRVHKKLRAERPYLLYTNRGIGTTRIKVRFGSKPEVSVFTLLTKKG
ncbi:metallophosphoesterase [Cohnella luojiensis]|nr:metallophosphoesterase [Cohnella luojiensis]